MDLLKISKFMLIFVLGLTSGALLLGDKTSFFAQGKIATNLLGQQKSGASDPLHLEDNEELAKNASAQNSDKEIDFQNVIQDQEKIIAKLIHENDRIQKELVELKGSDEDNIKEKNSLQDTPEERLTLTAEYFHTSKLNEAFSSAIEQSMKGSLNSPEEAEQFKEIFDRHLNWQQLEPTFLKIYAEVFTAQELHDMVQFNHSPLGRKLIEKGPELSQKSVTEMQTFMKKMLPEFKNEIENARAVSNSAKSNKSEVSKL